MTEGNKDGQEQRVGYAVDPAGRSVIDPTKNVLDLVKAESQYQNDMRDAEARMQKMSVDSLAQLTSYRHDAESKLQTWMRDAERDRINQLASLRDNYEKRIADMLSDSVKSNSQLVATQLLQIQGSFGERLNRLEEFRLTSQGRSSVAEPQMASAIAVLGSNMHEMQELFGKSIADMAAKQTDATGKLTVALAGLSDRQSGVSNKEVGRRELIAWAFGALMLMAATAGPLINLFHPR